MNNYIVFFVPLLMMLSCEKSIELNIGSYNGDKDGYNLTLEVSKKKHNFTCIDYYCVIDEGKFINESFSSDDSVGCFKGKVYSDIKIDLVNYRDFNELKKVHNKFTVKLKQVNKSTILWQVDSTNTRLLPYLPYKMILEKFN